MRGNGNRASRRATRMATVKRADGRVEAMGSQSGRVSGPWGQYQPERRIRAREADVVKRRRRIMENGKKSAKKEIGIFKVCFRRELAPSN